MSEPSSSEDAKSGSSNLESQGDLIAALGDVQGEIEEYFRAIPRDDLYRRPEEGVWSPAENLIHLIRSVKAVASGLAMPKAVLALMFGVSRNGSRSFAEMREVYRSRLAAGGRAGGKYVPPKLEIEDDEAAESTRERILAGWRAAAESLLDKLRRRWREESLDRYRMPHPLLGTLTVREMLFFTLYHDRHHLESVRRRRGDAAP